MKKGYMIVLDTLVEGTVPSVYDGQGEPCIFMTRVEAEREIADNLITRLQEFIEGQRDFEDAMTVEEYIVEVEVADYSRAQQIDPTHPTSPTQPT